MAGERVHKAGQAAWAWEEPQRFEQPHSPRKAKDRREVTHVALCSAGSSGAHEPKHSATGGNTCGAGASGP